MHWVYAHLIGDYVLQYGCMNYNKKRLPLNCLVHVLMYMLPFIFCDLNYIQLTLIALQHYIVDRTNFVVWFMKLKYVEIFISEDDSQWSIIIIDNMIYILWIAFIEWIWLVL